MPRQRINDHFWMGIQKIANGINIPQFNIYITMSKQRKTGDIKDNNISSKLLGANLSDINIQKFRDLSLYRKDKYDLGGKITLPILKTISFKFSPEVIFSVVLPGQAISNIDALSDCVNLMVLNLSKNSIENLAPLKNLKKLRILNMAQNCLTNAQPLSKNQQLVNLHLQGNMIKGVDQLRGLKSCSNLKNLHLQSLNGGIQNPICELQNYRKNLFQEFGQVKRLDSIPFGIQFANGSELKVSQKKEIKLDIKAGPFYCNKFPTIPAYTPPQFSQEKSLKQSISSCKSALQDLELRMRAILTM